jgi:hypothetical protein
MLAALLLATLVLGGCGVDFSNGESGTEFFKSLKVTGTPTAGARLTLVFGYAQNNPVDVAVKCELRQGKTLVKEIATQTVAQLAGGGPKATPVAGTYAFDFIVDQPGAYKAECFTPADENNFIIHEFTVRPGALSTAPGG